MEKRPFPNLESEFKLKPYGISGKLSGFSHQALGIIKFILGVFLLPFVYAASVSFLNEFNTLEKSLQRYFWSGLITLLITYLFIWEPGIIYRRGQKLVELVFSFFKPLVRVAPYLLPIYSLVLFIIYGILFSIFSAGGGSAFGGKSDILINNFLFLFGFSMGLHLIFSAKSIRSKEQGFLKANYIFAFAVIYIINLMLLAFFLNIIFEKFSLVNFLNNSFQFAKNIFSTVFKQLFL